MVEVSEYIKRWSEKLGISEEDILKDFNGLVEDERKIHKDASEDEQKTRALQRLAMIFKKQLRSPAIGFEGMLIGASDLVDTVARVRREAKALYKENPQKAIVDGITDDDGVPLDTRQEWSTGNPNRNFGKPLPENNWLRTIFGIAMKSGNGGDPKPFIMNVGGEVARNEDIPIFKPVKFRAIDRSGDNNDTYTLNSSMFTKFEVDETLSLPKPKDMLTKYCSNMMIDISNLEEYHLRVKDDYNRLAIVEGDVSTLILEPTSVGSRRIVLEDESKMLEDLESLGVICWIPPRINIDFGEQSKVIVLGRTTQGKKLGTDGKTTDEPGDMMLNVFGLYAIPEYKIEPNIKEITEKETEADEEEEPQAEKNW